MKTTRHYLRHLLVTKTSTCLLCSAAFLVACHAQWVVAQPHIQFKELNWEQAFNVAEKNKKFLFVDVYSGSRNDQEQKKFENSYFQTDSVATFFNANFISIRVDMSDSKNRSFAPSLQSLMYPVYLFLAENGDQIGYISSYDIKKTPSSLMESAKRAIAKGLIKRDNTKKIIFKKLTWSQASAKAGQENKLIFFDAYTNWCRPCVQMEKDIFTLDKVADFFNDNFINIKTNSEQGEGILIKEKYAFKAFPTFLFVDAEGNPVARDEGYKNESQFLALARSALSEYRYKSINFIVQDLETAKEQARKEKKLIFFDAYTTWCGPCKQMDKKVFTRYDVAKYYNDKYVNVKYDMEKGAGVQLKSNYEINAFPTYLILDPDGNVLHRVVGALPAKNFIQFGKEGNSNLNLSTMKAEYEAGNNDPGFVLRYIDLLQKANLGEEMNKVADAYFVTLDPSQKISRPTWKLINKHIVNADAEAIKYLVENKEKFTALAGDTVDTKLYHVYFRELDKFAGKDEKNTEYDEKGFKKYLKQVKKLSLKKYDQFEAYAWIRLYTLREDWKNYVNNIDEYMHAGTIDDGAFSVYNYALTVAHKCNDVGLRKIAWEWLNAMGTNMPDGYKKAVDKLKQRLIDKRPDSE